MRPAHVAALALSFMTPSQAWSQTISSSRSIDVVASAATRAPRDWPDSGIAQGSLFLVSGLGVGPFNYVVAPGLPLPMELGGTSIRVTVNGVPTDVPIVSAGYGAVVALLPSSVAEGDGTLVLTRPGRTDGPAPIRVVRSAFGSFARSGDGTGPAVAQNMAGETAQTRNALYNPARPRQAVALWGTGLGPVPEDDPRSGEALQMSVDLEVTVGGRPANVLSKGRAGSCAEVAEALGVPADCAGIDRVVFEAPEGVEGCYVPVAIRAGGVLSNFTTIAVAPEDQPCPDLPAGLKTADLERLANGESLNLAVAELARFHMRIVTPERPEEQVNFDLAWASFNRYLPQQLLASKASHSLVRSGAPSPGFCMLGPYSASYDIPMPSITGAGDSGLLLSAGSSLSLAGPGRNATLPRVNRQYISVVGGRFTPAGVNLPLFLAPGGYALSGGADTAQVGEIRAALTLPEPAQWTNHQTILEVLRSQDLEVTWESQAAGQELVTVFGITGDTEKSPVAFLCVERASKGSFVIPQSLLSALPPSRDVQGAGGGWLGIAVSSRESDGVLSATGIDAGRFGYVWIEMKNLAFR